MHSLTSKHGTARPWTFRLFSSLMGKTLGEVIGQQRGETMRERETERVSVCAMMKKKNKNLFFYVTLGFCEELCARKCANNAI